ncbi:nuclear pore complex protein Nup98-Nup96-like [Paramacrobiotus metropolitanus]|uniref:nuclear pore complex protein Nup98-Nup96-like n=1 Tax=Paramacrobiotus metropolitanus TaxID=2943436 RepID=UPI0024461071|nr:nuclear pore complex protein Nup98-Nup96-like [Paramacrobiotus metropolitanus]
MILRLPLSTWMNTVILCITFGNVAFAQNSTHASTGTASTSTSSSSTNTPKLLQGINLNGTGVLSGIPIPTMFPPVITPISETLRVKTDPVASQESTTTAPSTSSPSTPTFHLSDLLADNATLASLLAAVINTANKQLTVPSQASSVPAVATAGVAAPAAGAAISASLPGQQSGYSAGQAAQSGPSNLPGQVPQQPAPAPVNQNFAVLPAGGAYGGVGVQTQPTGINSFGFSGQQPSQGVNAGGIIQQPNTFAGGNTNFNTGNQFSSNQNQITGGISGIGGNQFSGAQQNPAQQNQLNNFGSNFNQQMQNNVGVTNQQQYLGPSRPASSYGSGGTVGIQQAPMQQPVQQQPIQQPQQPLPQNQQGGYGVGNIGQQPIQQPQQPLLQNQQGGYGGNNIGQQQIQQPQQPLPAQNQQGGYGGGGAGQQPIQQPIQQPQQPLIQNQQQQGGYGSGGAGGIPNNNFPPTYATPLPTGFTAAPTFPPQPLTGFTAAPTPPMNLQTPLPINSNTYNQMTSGFPLPVGYYASPQQSGPGGILPPPTTGYGGGASMQQVVQPAVNNQNVNNNQQPNSGFNAQSGNTQNAAGYSGPTAQANTAFLGGGGGISAGGGFQGLQPVQNTNVNSQAQNQQQKQYGTGPFGSAAPQGQQQQLGTGQQPGQTNSQGNYGSSSYSGGVPNQQVQNQFANQGGNTIQGGQTGFGGVVNSQQPVQQQQQSGFGFQGVPNQNQQIGQPQNQQNPNLGFGNNVGNVNSGVSQQSGYGNQNNINPGAGSFPQNTNIGSVGQQGINQQQQFPSGVQNQPNNQVPAIPATPNQIQNQQVQQSSISVPGLQGGYGQASGGQPVNNQPVQIPASAPPVILSAGQGGQNTAASIQTPIPPANLGQNPTTAITAPNVLVQNPGTTTPFSGFGGLGSLAQSIQEQLGVTRPTTTGQPATTSSNPFPVITPTVQPGVPVSNTIATSNQGINTQVGSAGAGQQATSNQQMQQPSAQFPLGSQFGAQQATGGQPGQQINPAFGNAQQTGGQFGLGGVNQVTQQPQTGVNQAQNVGNVGGYNTGSLGGGIPVSQGIGGGFGQQASGGLQNIGTANTGGVQPVNTGQQQQNINQPVTYATLNRGNSYR